MPYPVASIQAAVGSRSARVKAGSPLLNGLVAYWKMDETSDGSGAVTRNDSAGANHLTDNGTTPSAAAVVGNGCNFTRANKEYLSCNSNATLQTGDIDFSFAIWVNFKAVDVVQWIAQKWNPDNANKEWLLRYNTATSRLEFLWYINASGTNVKATANNLGAPQINTWYLVVIRRNKTTQKIDISVNGGTPNEATGATGGNAGAGQLLIGTDSYIESLVNGYTDEAAMWKRYIADAEVAELYNGGSGNTHPFFSVALDMDSLIVFDGNSMTDGAYSTYPATTLAALSTGWAGLNFGVSGQTTIGMLADAAAQIDTHYLSTRPKNIVVCWEGSNDLKLGATRADAQARLVQYCQERQAAGWSVVILTILPRRQSGLPATFEDDRTAINAYILANYASFADAVADVAAVAEMADPTNTTYYADGVHPTALAYNTLIAPVVAAAVEAL